MVVLTSIHNLCFEHKYEKYQRFLSENFQFLEVKFSIYLNKRVFVMRGCLMRLNWPKLASLSRILGTLAVFSSFTVFSSCY